MATKKNEAAAPTVLESTKKARAKRRKTDEQMERESARQMVLETTFSHFGPVLERLKDDDGNVEEVQHDEAAILPWDTLEDVRNGRPLAASSYVPTVTKWALENGHDVSVVSRDGGVLIVKR